MNDTLKKWSMATLALFVLISVAHYIWKPMPVVLYAVAVGVALLTYFIHLRILKANDGGPNAFLRAFMVSTMIKIALLLGFVAVVFYLKPPFYREIGLFAGLAYVVFLTLSVRDMQAVLRSANKK